MPKVKRQNSKRQNSKRQNKKTQKRTKRRNTRSNKKRSKKRMNGGFFGKLWGTINSKVESFFNKKPETFIPEYEGGYNSI